MTPTWPSTTAGAEPPFGAWLRRVARAPAARGWLLRGSLVTASYCPDGRRPMDADHLLPGPASLDLAAAEAAVRAIVAEGDARGPALTLDAVQPTWVGTANPGLRVRLGSSAGPLQVDLAAGDPVVVAPRRLLVRGAPVLACAPETLFAWKVHGLAEHGRGRWRAKDLFDADLLWRRGLNPAWARAELALAFASRGQSPDLLGDLLGRPTWGGSSGSARKWRWFGATEPLVAVRDRLRGALELLLA